MSDYLQCRLCAQWQISNELINIKKREAIQLNLESKIQQCLHLDFENPLLPNNICLLCSAKVTATHDFQELVKKAQQCLLDSIAEKKPNLKTELPDSENNSYNYVETLLNEYNDVSVKQEDVEIEEDLIDTKNVPQLSGQDDTKNIEQLKLFELEKIVVKKRVRKCNIKNGRVQKKLDVKNTELKLTSELAKQKAARGELIQRIKDEWQAYKWKCVVCLIEITSLKEFRNHFSNEHKQDPKYSCMECSKVYDSYPYFKKHVRAHRNKFKHKCEICSRFFHCNQLYKDHLAIHSSVKKFTCTKCGKSYGTSNGLRSHLRTHQSMTFECEICNKKLNSKPGLLHHRKIHLGQKDFTCDQCGKGFINRGLLNGHLRTAHSNARPYSCEHCSRSFKSQSNLKVHLLLHSAEKQYACEVCDMRFRRKDSLTRHSSVHTGVLAFSCEYCQKAFRTKQLLQVHIRQHTGERPYACLECNHHFTDSSNYIKHMKGKHEMVVSRKNATNRSDSSVEKEKMINNTLKYF